MTEKNYNPEQQQMKTMKKQETTREFTQNQELSKPREHLSAVQKIEAPAKKEEVKKQEVSASIEDSRKKEETKVEDKKEKKQDKKIIKKDEAIVNGISLPISTKTSAAICKFIKRKTIDKAIADLEEVLKFKKVIPMTGEIPHKKGKGIMSGRYPIKAIGFFIIMLKSLKANANMNGMDEPIIVEAVPNRASRPYGRSGSIKRKRTHVKIKVMEKKLISKKKK